MGDWGSTRLRLWRLEEGAVAGWREGPGITNTDDPAAALLETLGDWPAGRVILSGMAGAREGLRQVPYVPCPADRAKWRAAAVRFEIGGKSVTIAPGFSCDDDRRGPDVMRGEETQIFGAMVLVPALESGHRLVILPGTHSKWVWLADNHITHFRTYMTGELYSLLGNSTLAFAAAADDSSEDEGFHAGLARSATGIRAFEGLFEARAAQMRDGKSPAWAGGFVSGLLIGGELFNLRMAPPAEPPLVIGTAALAARYGSALEEFGVSYETADAVDCAIAGLRLLDDD
jgi:2-dehydro-3-deoxygalactonokinase